LFKVSIQNDFVLSALETESIGELLDLVFSKLHAIFEPQGAGVFATTDGGLVKLEFSKYLCNQEFEPTFSLSDMLSLCELDCNLKCHETYPQLVEQFIGVSGASKVSVTPIKLRHTTLGLLVIPYSKEVSESHVNELRFCLTLLARCIGRYLKYSSVIAQAAASDYPSLTDRQRQIASLVVRGFTNSDIALELHVSLGTVKAEVSKIIHKLGATNRASIYLPPKFGQD
jgi:DNA-binding CsgD family transcriptional regulator